MNQKEVLLCGGAGLIGLYLCACMNPRWVAGFDIGLCLNNYVKAPGVYRLFAVEEKIESNNLIKAPVGIMTA
ncbi:MAG TPA: hypothetical protein VF268_01290 [Gammaproteobacteria bacterium]